MALNVISNFAANVAHRNLVINDRGATRDIAKLSSGLRVLGARDDAASLAIGSRLKAEVGALRQANVNAGQANSLLQVADGALNTVAHILFRLKTLSVQSGSDNVGAAERASLQLEFVALQEEIERIARDTEFTGVQLINGEEKITTQVGDDSTPEAGAGLRLINNAVGSQQGITDIQFSDSFDSSLVDISYAVVGTNGVFTVTDLSLSPEASGGRTATGATALPLLSTATTDLRTGQTETIDVVFDRGGANERTVSITIDDKFNKREFTTTRLDNTARLTAPVGFNAADTFAVNDYGGNLAGLSRNITAEQGTAISASTLRIANQFGDDLVATTAVDFTDLNAQTVQFENSAGDFVNVTIDLDAALVAASYTALQDGTVTTAELRLESLNGEGNDLVSGNIAIQSVDVATQGSIANLVNSGNLAVRQIGGTADNESIALSYNADTNTFEARRGTVTETSEVLSGSDGTAGSATVTVDNRAFEITVSETFDRNTAIDFNESEITDRTVTGDEFNANVGTGGSVIAANELQLRLVSFTPGANGTLEDVLAGLSNTNFVLQGADSAAVAPDNTITATLGNFTGRLAAAGIAAAATTNVTLTNANGDTIVVAVVNASAATAIVAGVAVAADNDTLDLNESLTIEFTQLSDAVFSAGGGTAGASFDITQVSGDLTGLDNRIRIAKGATGRELSAAVLSIAHADTTRGDLFAEIDLTVTGPQTVILENDAGDTVGIDFNLATLFNERQLDRRGTAAETFFLIGDLARSAIYGKSFSSERSFSFKVGSGVLEEDNVVFDVGAANLRALGLETTGPKSIRIDGSDKSAADNASVAVSGAIDRLNNVRAIVGAGQNRLEFSANNVATAIENAEAARSVLLDLDVAAGITAFTSKQVLVQTGISVLAQANQQPQQLLRLFQ